MLAAQHNDQRQPKPTRIVAAFRKLQRTATFRYKQLRLLTKSRQSSWLPNKSELEQQWDIAVGILTRIFSKMQLRLHWESWKRKISQLNSQLIYNDSEKNQEHRELALLRGWQKWRGRHSRVHFHQSRLLQGQEYYMRRLLLIALSMMRNNCSNHLQIETAKSPAVIQRNLVYVSPSTPGSESSLDCSRSSSSLSNVGTTVSASPFVYSTKVLSGSGDEIGILDEADNDSLLLSVSPSSTRPSTPVVDAVLELESSSRLKASTGAKTPEENNAFGTFSSPIPLPHNYYFTSPSTPTHSSDVPLRLEERQALIQNADSEASYTTAVVSSVASSHVVTNTETPPKRTIDDSILFNYSPENDAVTIQSPSINDSTAHVEQRSAANASLPRLQTPPPKVVPMKSKQTSPLQISLVVTDSDHSPAANENLYPQPLKLAKPIKSPISANVKAAMGRRLMQSRLVHAPPNKPSGISKGIVHVQSENSDNAVPPQDLPKKVETNLEAVTEIAAASANIASLLPRPPPKPARRRSIEELMSTV